MREVTGGKRRQDEGGWRQRGAKGRGQETEGKWRQWVGGRRWAGDRGQEAEGN